jgi:hypothetical protein
MKIKIAVFTARHAVLLLLPATENQEAHPQRSKNKEVKQLSIKTQDETTYEALHRPLAKHYTQPLVKSDEGEIF